MADQTIPPHTEFNLPAEIRALMPLMAEKFYANLRTHVGADAKGNVIGPPIDRDPDEHTGLLRYSPGEPIVLRIDPTERIMGFLNAAASAFEAKPGEVATASHSDALLRMASPRIPGVLRVCVVSAAGVHVLDLHRPSPLDSDAVLPDAS